MSLVAYGSSDESSDDEEVTLDPNGTQTTVTTVGASLKKNGSETNIEDNSIDLPVPKSDKISKKFDDHLRISNEKENECRIQFNSLPKPIGTHYSAEDIPEEDDVPLFKQQSLSAEKSVKPNKPVRISIPSLSEFKDVDEELEKSKNRRTASKKGTGLFAVLPPPKSETQPKKSNFIPHVLTKISSSSTPKRPLPVTKPVSEISIETVSNKVDAKETKNPPAISGYDSNSEDDNEEGHKHDFFSLTTPQPEPELRIASKTNFFSISDKVQHNDLEMTKTVVKNIANNKDVIELVPEMDEIKTCGMTLISTVMDLPREEILLKNKAEVGPKLPVPEQEFNVDSDGNVAFDEKAIEYLCGKRGIKRKNQMIEEANIIEINGEDMKSDEREWMVKALTEEPVQRPVSMQGAGPSSQSKKKHQITYLAHQAKAMEVELKNTWSQNRSTRKQTQSKYGF